MFVVVGANLIWNDQDQLLLVQEGKQRAKDLWNLPGGTLEHGEHPRDCAIREAREETGLIIEPDRRVGQYLGTGDFGKQRIINVCYASTVTDQEPSIDPQDTVIDWQWVRPEELSSLELRAAYIETVITDVQHGTTETGFHDCYT
ncbi:MAG: NUDIX hydrolase [Candidatus Nanohaloarchaeota archaeon QJJ-5]|nr:NUDIX hydrolase [Candidatus Nanohaloarchaeota archaeon QJJ-5]